MGSHDEDAGMSANEAPNQTALRLILTMAAFFPSGSSKIGREVADYLGVSFPLRMADLERRARASGFNPDDLWPWREQSS